MVIYFIWFTALYITVRLFQDENPSWAEARNDDRFMGVLAISSILVTIYLLWFVFYLCRALKDIRKLPPPFLFVFAITFFTFLTSCVGAYMGAMYVATE